MASADEFNDAAGGTAGQFTVPAGVTEIRITAEGGSGGTQLGGPGVGGAGAVVTGVFTVTPGDVVRYVIGDQPALSVSTFDAGGGGSTGVFINSTLVIVAGGGAGYDNTQGPAGGQGGRASESGQIGLAAGGCTTVPGGTGGAGGLGGNNQPAGCGVAGDGGAGGGGINSAGATAAGGATGGGAADLNPLDGLTVAPGGTTPGGAEAGANGGAGFTGGGASEIREAGGGGGYSGGGGANSSGRPGGGGSFVSSTALLSSKTDGANNTNNGDGSIRVQWSRIAVQKTVVNDSGGTAVPADFTLRLSSTLGDVTTATAYASGDVINIRSGGGTNTYTLSEDTLAGYTQTGNTCTALAHTAANIGTDYTCTISNNDNTIQADDDDFSATPVNGATGGVAGDALAGDTLNGVQVTAAQVTTTVVTPATPIGGGPVPVLSTGGATEGQVTVPPGTPAGVYTITYQICETANLTNCDTALITVVVDATPIDAVDDAPAAVSSLTGATIPTVLGNDTLAGVAVDPADITLTPGPAPTPAAGSITMNPDGTITVAPGTTPGTYPYTYQICETANPTNCDTATASVIIDVTPIVADDDDFSGNPISPTAGGTAGNVFGNDTLGGAPFPPTAVTPSVTDDGGLGGVSISEGGDLLVPPGTPPGTYAVTYQICEVLNPTNCDTAIATVVVAAPVTTALVTDISEGNIPGTPVTLRVFGNDSDPDDVFDRSTLRILGTGGPGQPLVVPGEGTWTVDIASGSITFTPEAGFTGNPTPVQYQIDDLFGNAIAPAFLIITYEQTPGFVCSDVIGKVFDDINQNGRQDEGEAGLPAVRLATLNGEIITTDEYGRFSVPCAAIPRDIGSTFQLKLDPRSLPTGYRVTTENPKTVRLTPGMMRRMNFGATLSNLVRVDLTAEAFDPATGNMVAALDRGLAELVQSIARTPSTLRLTYFAGNETTELARSRLDEVERRLRALWRGEGRYQLNLETTIVRRN